jgi:hypothetical protein
MLTDKAALPSQWQSYKLGNTNLGLVVSSATTAPHNRHIDPDGRKAQSKWKHAFQDKRCKPVLLLSLRWAGVISCSNQAVLMVELLLLLPPLADTWCIDPLQ